MGRRAVVFLLVIAMLLPVAASAAKLQITPLLDLRVRQEVLDGVLYFAPDPDGNWIRVRARGGARADLDDHSLALRLTNEHRHFLHPESQPDWDELILDRAFWQCRMAASTTFTLGRQDIIWPGGFLMLEARPYDGSRAIFQNAVRLQHGGVDLSYIRNLQRDHLVIAGDDQRRLRDMDETGIALQVTDKRLSWSAIYKSESDPRNILRDLVTGTFGLRYAGPSGDTGSWEAEVAVQYLKLQGDEGDREGEATAMALQAFYENDLGDRGTRLEVGGFFYSGNSDKDWASFRAPWGRWPKWSELYIYTLIGESTPGRVTVAAWENIAAPRLQLRHPLGHRWIGRLGLNYLLAPEPSWQARGLLTQAELEAELGAGFSGHLLWEMLVPGAFHDGSNGLAPLTDPVHFLRWQIMWTI